MDTAVLVFALADEAALERFGELQGAAVGIAQFLGADDRRQATHFQRLGVAGEQLAGDVGVILAGEVLADAVLHQARQRRQHGDRRIHALVGQLAPEHDLAFGDVAGQVGNWVGDVVGRHGQHRNQGDGAAPILDPPCPLVDFREVGIEIAGIALARRHVAAQHRHFTQRLGVGGHVGHHHQHVGVQVKGQVFGGGERRARGEQALDHRLVGQVEEHHHLVQHAAFLEAFLEETRVGVRGAEGGEHHHEFRGGFSQQLRLAHDLRRHPVMRQAAAGEDRQLLAAGERVHAVNGGNASLDELARIGAGGGVERFAVDVAAVTGNDRRTPVARQAGAIEHAAKEIARDRQLERLIQETYPGALQVEFVGALEHFHQHGIVSGADHQAVAQAPGVVFQLHTRARRHAGHTAHDDQAALSGGRGTEFNVFHHCCQKVSGVS